jgi:hypothetical protein
MVESVGYRVWNTIRNSGDAITPYIIELATGAIPVQVPGNVPHLLAAGSTFHLANENSNIWGSGVLNKNVYAPKIHKDRIHALRGMKTADYLTSIGISLNDVPLGDPGIFAADILRRENVHDNGRRYRGAIVPHHSYQSHPFFASLRGSEELCVVNICDDSLLPLIQISRSDIVVCQSLHALIYAESFGKPAVWITDHYDEVWNFKFEDWFSTTLNPKPTSARLTDKFEDVIRKALVFGNKIDKTALLKSFPNEAVVDCLERQVDFRMCRHLAPLLVFCDLPATVFHDSQEINRSYLQIVVNTVSPSLKTLFKSWAEPVYTICVGHGSEVVPMPHQSSLMVGAMDAMHEVDFGFVALTKDLERLGHIGQPLGTGVFMYPDFVKATPTVIVRPSCNVQSGRAVLFSI